MMMYETILFPPLCKLIFLCILKLGNIHSPYFILTVSYKLPARFTALTPQVPHSKEFNMNVPEGEEKRKTAAGKKDQ